VAKSVNGVKEVDNNLEIRNGPTHSRHPPWDDTEITAKVKAALIEDRRVKAREVEVKTYKGIVHAGWLRRNPRKAKTKPPR